MNELKISLEAALAAYQEVSTFVKTKRKASRAIKYLEKKELNFGICYFLNRKFNHDSNLRLRLTSLIRREVGSSDYLTITPERIFYYSQYEDYNDKKILDDILESLRIRIEFLNKIISEL